MGKGENTDQHCPQVKKENSKKPLMPQKENRRFISWNSYRNDHHQVKQQPKENRDKDSLIIFRQIKIKISGRLRNI